MFSKELLDLLIQVVSSWQVIAVTLALLIYFSLVFYVARRHRRRPRSGFSPPSVPRGKKKSAPEPEVEITDEDDELGLEEG